MFLNAVSSFLRCVLRVEASIGSFVLLGKVLTSEVVVGEFFEW